MAQTAIELVKTYASSFASLFGTADGDVKEHPTPHKPVAHPPEGVVLLSPARSGARLVLLPLLPPPKARIELPSEVWRRCITFAMNLTRERNTLSAEQYSMLLASRRDLLLVSKQFKNLASPMLYAEIKIYGLDSLASLHTAVISGDQRWDNLRRIPHSTPGRWVQSLDISYVAKSLESRSERFKADTLLSDILNLLPFLEHFISDSKFALSGRAIRALGGEGGRRLRVIRGLAAHEDFMSLPTSPWLLERDPLIGLLRSCGPTLESFEVIGPGATQDEGELIATAESLHDSFPSLSLPHLHTLVLNGVPCAPVFFALLHSPLPSLVRLTITVYPSRHMNDVQNLSAAFLAAHADTIESLILPTPPDWPPPNYVGIFTLPSSHSSAYYEHSVLHLLPKLTRLNLSFPLPPILLLPLSSSPLKTILFPRPIPALLPFVQEMAQGTGEKGSGLRKVVWTKARWLRNDVGNMSRYARTAGDQGEMLRWRRTLGKMDVQLIDADGKMLR